jgi:hypothetical protein
MTLRAWAKVELRRRMEIRLGERSNWKWLRNDMIFEVMLEEMISIWAETLEAKT